MRLEKPIGVWLLALPCLWGIWVAPFLMNQTPAMYSLLYNSILFILGAVVMRSAGCVINDYCDRNIDKCVARTKNRPLASGAIKPINALILFCILSLIGFLILLQLPMITIMMGCLVFIPIMIYPLMKRFTYFPQLFLGLIYNSGIIMGFVTISGVFNPHILWLYAAGVMMTVAYDTIYAFQDIHDDIKIGVKSTAIAWQHNPKLWIGMCYALGLICFALFFDSNIMINCILLFVATIISTRLYFWNIADNQQSLKNFKDTLYLLIGLWFLIILSYFYSYGFILSINRI
jgi:4-hydroxybenzoate polyprenyl transferase